MTGKIGWAFWRRVKEAQFRLDGWTQAARADAGQTVAEYALVLLVVAAIAVAFLLWARQSGKLDAFFDLIFERLIGTVDSQTTPPPA